MREIICRKCGHRGDIFESTVFADKPNQFKFKLVCAKCGSDSVIGE